MSNQSCEKAENASKKHCGPGAKLWVVGSCTGAKVNADGTCFESDPFSNTKPYKQYKNNKKCTVMVQDAPGILQLKHFNLEAHGSCAYDWLRVKGKKYCSVIGPANVEVQPGDTIEFSTDGSATRTGFKVCVKPISGPRLDGQWIVGAKDAKGGWDMEMRLRSDKTPFGRDRGNTGNGQEQAGRSRCIWQKDSKWHFVNTSNKIYTRRDRNDGFSTAGHKWTGSSVPAGAVGYCV